LNSNASYDKIKHLVEIEDDIFAGFTINSRGKAYDLTVAKKIDFEKNLIENIFTNFNNMLKQDGDKIIDIAILVAVNAVAIKNVSSASNPYKENTI
jgi:hypothetical protein